MFRIALTLALFVDLALAVDSAWAQTSPAFGPLPTPSSSAPADDMPLADYLGLLQQISPSAESGARVYVAAMRLRCRRELTTAELRQAIAEGEGNPILMGLIRAVHLKDIAARDQLIAQLSCHSGGIR